MQKDKILLVEDNADARLFLKTVLGKHFDVLLAENGIEGIEKAKAETPKLILLDIMMPFMDGYETCRHLKSDSRTSHIPIIFLTAKSELSDITQGLDIGGTDYVTKPFDYRELIARIQAKLRDLRETQIAKLTYGPYEFDLISRELKTTDKSQPPELTVTEFDLVVALIQNLGKELTRKVLAKDVWKDPEQEFSRTIDVHIRSIRKKLPTLALHLKSTYGVGYMLQEFKKQR